MPIEQTSSATSSKARKATPGKSPRRKFPRKLTHTETSFLRALSEHTLTPGHCQPSSTLLVMDMAVSRVCIEIVINSLKSSAIIKTERPKNPAIRNQIPVPNLYHYDPSLVRIPASTDPEFTKL